jgi:hypothetical protein
VIKFGEKKARFIFFGLLLLGIVVSLTAYGMTGDMGIEERFTHALGYERGGVEVGGGEWFGIAIEGSLLLYAIVLGVLMVICYIVYRYFSV